MLIAFLPWPALSAAARVSRRRSDLRLSLRGRRRSVRPGGGARLRRRPRLLGRRPGRRLRGRRAAGRRVQPRRRPGEGQQPPLANDLPRPGPRRAPVQRARRPTSVRAVLGSLSSPGRLARRRPAAPQPRLQPAGPGAPRRPDRTAGTACGCTRLQQNQPGKHAASSTMPLRGSADEDVPLWQAGKRLERPWSSSTRQVLQRLPNWTGTLGNARILSAARISAPLRALADLVE